MAEHCFDDTLYVLDSYGLIYRAYYAFINRPLTNSRGENVSAVFGFFRNLKAVLDHYHPRFMAAAFDSRTPTFRHKRYPEYKATRQKTPEDLHAQVPVIESILVELGIPVLRCDGFEADDIIATLAAQCRRCGQQCRILSADKDLMQLVDESVQMLKPDRSGGWELLTAAGVVAEWGVPPEKMLDLLSLTGDASDNVPGVAGVGIKTALKLLDTYGSLDGIYAAAEEISGAVGGKIRAGKENAYFSKELITLRTDVPVVIPEDNFSIGKLDFSAAAAALLKQGVPAVAKQYAASGSSGGDGTSPVSGSSGGSGTGTPVPSGASSGSGAGDRSATVFPGQNIAEDNTRGGVFRFEENEHESLKENTGDYRAVLSLPELTAFIDTICGSEQPVAAFDCETDSLDCRNAVMAGFSLSVQAGTGIYVPLQMPDSLLSAPPLSKQEALVQLNRLFSLENAVVVMHNGKFDYQVLCSNGLPEPRCRIWDTMVAAWLLEPERSSYSLESLAAGKLGLETIPYSAVVPKGAVFADVPLDTAVRYAAEDADLTWQLYQLFQPRLRQAELEHLFLTLEMPVLPVLARMETAGIHIEEKELAKYSTELSDSIAGIQKEIYELVGHEFNIASTKQLQQVLFEERGLPHGKKTKSGYSTDTGVLETLAVLDPVPRKILDYRAKSKLLSTYVDALPRMADSAGRIHTSFIQTGTATGRLSSRDPNLQNIPVRAEEGRRIRRAFTAAPGNVLISADYSQIELVILAHLSGDPGLCNAFMQGTDVHRATAALIFGVEPDAVTPDMRRTAKTINFGVMYGMSAFRLSNELGIPRSQAQSFIESYFTTYAGVRQFMDDVIRKAEQTGAVETLFGRRRYIHGITSRNKLEKSGAERIAVNTPIQGSAADIVKQAMLDVTVALTRNRLPAQLLLQVHDELIFECPENIASEAAACIKSTMENVITLRVPLKVSVETGVRWGDFH